MPTGTPALTIATPPASTVATQPPTQAAPPTPAAQVAQALVEPVKVVLTNPTQSTSTAPHVTTIQITPVELGRVDIRIERTLDGPAKIQLVAERPETLSRLVHDQSHLHQALDLAGLAPSGRTIEFSLAPSTTTTNPASSSLTENPGGSMGGNGSQRQGRYSNQNTPEEPISASTSTTRSMRFGLDITA